MTLNLKKLLSLSTFILALLFNANINAQSSCCSKSDKTTSKTTSCTSSTKDGATSGCSPSACRGAKTKFGEAKVISELRMNLIALKLEMEQSKAPQFDADAYDIHNIVGDTDIESLEIIVKEVKSAENHITAKLDHEISDFNLPDNKAKQVQYLNERIEQLKLLL